jgi:hypothetical protein
VSLHIEDVISLTAASDIQDGVLSLCATAGLPTSSWQPGGVIRTMIAEISTVIAQRAVIDVEIAKGGFGDLASPEWAKLWAYQIYNVLFVSSATAKGYLQLTNTTSDPHTLQIGDLIVAHKTTGKTYRNQEVVEVAPLSTTSPFAIESDELGTASDAAPDEITVVVAPSALIGVTATNPAAVLGADEEKTEALVKRARAKLGHLSPRGPKGAYDYVARTPLDQFEAVDDTGLLVPTSTPITRSRTTLDPVTGNIIVFIATAGGAPTFDDVARVNAGIWRWAEPQGVTSSALAASEIAIDVSYRIWVKTTLTAAQLTSIVNTALVSYLAGVDVGGVVIAPDPGAIYREALEFVIHTAVPGVKRVQVSVPTGEYVPVNANHVPVLGIVTPTITFVS